MKTKFAKTWDAAADEYATMSTSNEAHAYEYEVNMPSFLEMMPKQAKNVLDVGTGSGDLITPLIDRYPKISGTDVSPKMIDFTKKKFPKNDFFLWDLEEKFDNNEKYDLILCKLVLMFVRDLNNVASEFYRLLGKNGTLIISVPHPTYWYYRYLMEIHGLEEHPGFATMTDGYYSSMKSVSKAIGGNKKLTVDFIHRTLSDYVNTFTKQNFFLEQVQEPRITEKFANRYPKYKDRKNIPLRLNMKFRKI